MYAGIAALIVIAAGGAAYALAGHGSSRSPAAGSTRSPAAGGATQAAARPAALSQLRRIVLRPADLPVGWKGAAFHPGTSDAAGNAAFMRCVGARNTNSDMVAEAHSAVFTRRAASISSSATSFRSYSALNSDLTTLRSPKLSPCFTQMIKKQLAASLPAGATVESASIKIKPGSAGGPANIVATGTGIVKVRVNGQTVPAYLTVAFITGPLIEAEVDAENVGSHVPATLVKSLVATVASRAAQG
jgi:hypothetical protein